MASPGLIIGGILLLVLVLGGIAVGIYFAVISNKKSGVGGSCENDDGCETGLTCTNKICTKPTTIAPRTVAAGGRCNIRQDCVPGLTCDNNVCIASAIAPGTVAAGGRCNVLQDCVSGLACTNNVCMASGITPRTVAAGGRCTAEPDCVTGLTCDNNVCRSTEAPEVCTADVFECPDGSFVSRDPQNGCQFRVCSTVTPTHDLANGKYYMQQQVNNRYVDAYENASNLFTFPLAVTRQKQFGNQEATQQWNIKRVADEPNAYTIQQVFNNRYLTLNPNDKYLRVKTEKTRLGNKSIWFIRLVAGNIYNIINKETNLYLDAYEQSINDYQIDGRIPSNGPDQRWILTPV